MSASEATKATTISRARSLDEVADYWGEHSLADHWDETTEAGFEVRARRRHPVNLDPDVFGDIRDQARQRGVATETLVNLWLKERLQVTAGDRS